jgi:hypothetical protein
MYEGLCNIFSRIFVKPILFYRHFKKETEKVWKCQSFINISKISFGNYAI